MPKKMRDPKIPKGSKEAMRPTIWDQPLQISPLQLEKIAAAGRFKLTDRVRGALEAIYGRYSGRRARSDNPVSARNSYREQVAMLEDAIATAMSVAKAVPLGGDFRTGQKKEFLDKLSDLHAITQRMRDRVKPVGGTTGDKPDFLTESLVNDLAMLWRSVRKKFNRAKKAGSFIGFVSVFCAVLDLGIPEASIDTAARKHIPINLRKVSRKAS